MADDQETPWIPLEPYDGGELFNQQAIRAQQRQTYAEMEAMLNDTRARAGMRGWLPGDGDRALFGLDRDTSKLAERRLPPQPWWRFVRLRRWLCELIAGRDFYVE